MKLFYNILLVVETWFRLYIFNTFMFICCCIHAENIETKEREREFRSSATQPTCFLLVSFHSSERGARCTLTVCMPWLGSKKIRLSHLFNFNNINLKTLVVSWISRDASASERERGWWFSFQPMHRSPIVFVFGGLRTLRLLPEQDYKKEKDRSVGERERKPVIVIVALASIFNNNILLFGMHIFCWTFLLVGDAVRQLSSAINSFFVCFFFLSLCLTFALSFSISWFRCWFVVLQQRDFFYLSFSIHM